MTRITVDREVLERLLDRYAKHDSDCVSEIWHGMGPVRCSCGLYEARAAALASTPSPMGREEDHETIPDSTSID